MKRVYFTIITLFYLFLIASPVFSATQDECDLYTKTAIAQFNEARSLGMETPFPTWSNDYNHHFNWCRTQELQAIEQGHALRQEQIEKFKESNKQIDVQEAKPGKTLQVMPGYKVISPAADAKFVNVTNVSTGSERKYLVLKPVKAGNKVYIDRLFTYTNLPMQLINAVQIQTSNEDKFSSGDRAFLTFSIDQPGSVYIAYDRRYKNIPGWLSAYEKTVDPVVYDTPGGRMTCDLYRKQFPAGKVVLGGNISAGSKDNFSMYTVFITPSGSAKDDTVRRSHRQQMITDLQNKIDAFNTMTETEFSNLNKRLDKAVNDNVARQKNSNYQMYKSIPGPDQIAAQLLAEASDANRAYSIDLKEYEALPRKKGEALKMQRKAKPEGTSVSMAIPKDSFTGVTPLNQNQVPVDGLAQIVSFPGSDALEPGDWVYLSGVGFGNTAGSITLEYSVNTNEFGNEWTEHKLTVTPGTYQLTWKNNIIVFHLPDTLPGINSTDLGKGRGVGKASLKLTLHNGQTISRTVKLEPTRVNIVDIWTDSTIDVTYFTPKTPDHWVRFDNSPEAGHFYTRMPDRTVTSMSGFEYKSIEPGSEVYIHGNGFSDTPGQIEILAGNQKVPITPVGSDWWSNYCIRFRVGDIPGFLSREAGTLTIRTANGQTLTNTGFVFVYGPQMTVKVVSGNKWFEPEWDEDSSYAKPDENDLVLFVSHDPGCGWVSTSESGWDYFYRSKKLPEGVILKHFTFIEIEDKNANNQMNFLKNYFKDLLGSLDGLGFLDVALGVITKNLKMVIKSAIDSIFGDGGGYYAYMPSPPQADVDSPALGVMWENSCSGANEGLPIMYMTTYVVTGPKSVLDKM